jgi:hypothetical protein
MMRWLRRLIWLGILAGGGYAALRVVRRQQPAPATNPQWPPLATEPVADTKAGAKAKPAPGEALRWVEPVNGDCPDGYPVKANDNSGIYHVPGGRFYDRTVAERCYANADDALADGYRPAKT